MSTEIAVYFDPSIGALRRFAAADVLAIDAIDRLAGSGDMTIGSNLGATEELQLGSATSDVRVLGDLLVDGSSTVSVDETVTGTFNANGNVNLGNNSGDAIALGGGTSDTVNLNADLTVGNNALGIGSSTTDAVDELWLSSVAGGAGSGINLNATGNGTSGSEAIGVYITGFVNFTPGASDLQSVLEAIDTAIGSGGATLQTAYAAGNTIAVTTANGAVQISNSADVTDTLEVSRTFVGAGIGIDLQMGPGNEAVTGVGLSITSGTGATGDMLFVNNLGSGDALDVQDGGVSVLQVTGAGAVNLTPTSGQNLTLTAAGAGTIPISAAGAITIDSTGAGISLDAAGASNFSTSAGDLSLDAAAGELSFDDVGNSGLTLSQASDRTLAQTGAGEILNGVTSIVGAVNALAEFIEVDGGPFVVELTAGTGGFTAGDCVAQDATNDQAVAWDGNNNTNSKFIGIALNTVAATGTVRVALPGSVVTDSGATFTAGNALFGPDGTGRPTATAPSGAGDAVKRIGFALSATRYVIETGPTVII